MNETKPKMKNQLEYTSLNLSITSLEKDALPGYEGDARLNWDVQKHDSFRVALDFTVKSFKRLRTFWDAKASKEVPKANDSHILPVGGIDFDF
jgi:hypothetical protein